MIKTYNHESVKYGYSRQTCGWRFELPDNVTFISHVTSREKADKVARIISGSMKRCGGVDNLARANMRMIEG